VTTSVKAQLDERPNIVMIVVDDMSYSDLDFYGGEIETPTLSSLADEGVLFTNFHAGSICSPSRAMFNTGVDSHRGGMGAMLEQLAPNQVGRPGYEGYLNDRVVTTASLLKDAGYNTYMAGKWHLGGAEGQQAGKLPGQRGFERNFALLDGAGGFYSNLGLDGTYGCVRFVEDDQPIKLPLNAPYYQCEEQPSEPPKIDQRVITQLPDNPEQDDFYITEYITEKVLEYVEEDKEDGKPFFAFVSYTAPHYPLQVPKEYITQENIDLYMKGWDELQKDRFQNMKEMGIITADIETPPTWPAILDPDDETKIITVDRWEFLTEEEQLQEATERAVYAGMLKYVDEQVQRIIDKLKELGEYKNTIIIFFSDNGGDAHDKDTLPFMIKWFEEIGVDNDNLDNLGGPLSWLTLTPGWTQLGMTPFWGEKATQTEGGTRAAFFVHYPKLNLNKQNINHAFISVLDLTPTILDYADVEHPGINYKGRFVFPMDGKSMRPIWEGWQTDIYRDNEPIAFEVKGKPNDNKSLYLGDYKIVTQVAPWGDGTWKLFNLTTDPAEQNDLSAQEPEKKAKMLAMYEEYEAEIGLVPAGPRDESFEPTPQTFKRPDSRLTLHADNVDNLPEMSGIYEGVPFERDQYVTVFKAGGEITAHVVWGQDENGKEVLHAFKTEEEVLTNLDKVTAKTLKKNTIKDISQFPIVFDGILFSPDEYNTYFDQGLQIDMYLALEQRFGYPVVHAFLNKGQLTEFYKTAQDKRCQSVLGNNVKEKTNSPLKVDVYWSGETGTSVSSLLIQGKDEAILVGAQNRLSEGKKVADWIEKSGKQLKKIFISHAHPNRSMGIQAILDKFPGTPVYATMDVIEDIRLLGETNLIETQNQFGDDAPSDFIVPEPYERDYLVIEGQCVEIMPFSKVDGMQSYTALYIHSTQTLFSADIATRGGHSVMTVDGPLYQNWLNVIEKLKAKKPKQVITGHAASAFQADRGPEVFDETLDYIKTYTRIVSESATKEEAQAAIQAKYPDYDTLPGILAASLAGSYPSDEGESGEDAGDSDSEDSGEDAGDSGDSGEDAGDSGEEDTSSQLKTTVYVADPNGFVTSTLIEGTEEAILVDTQFSAENAQDVVKMIEDSGKKLNAIWITHAHPDHFVGLEALLEQYPNTPVYSTTEVVDSINQRIPSWQEQFGLSDDLTVPEVLDGSLELDGESIEIKLFAQGDTENSTAVYVPSLETLIASDLLYCGVHAWNVETNAESRSGWINSLNQIKEMNPKYVIPGHKYPATLDNDPACVDSTIEYLEKFSEVVEAEETAEDAIAAMLKIYPDYEMAGILQMSMQNQYEN